MMKDFKRVIERKIGEVNDIDAMQLGSMPGKCTIGHLFIAHQLQERYVEKKKETIFALVDLENAFDRVPIEVIKRAMKKLGVVEWLIRAVVTLYRNSNSVIRVNNTVVEKFDVKVGVHQSSILSSCLFVLVLEALPRKCKSTLPRNMLYADDLVTISESLVELDT